MTAFPEVGNTLEQQPLKKQSMAQSAEEQLYNAVRKNNLKAIQKLIDQGIDIDAPYAKDDDDSRHTALSVAAILSRVEVAKLLIDAGADVNALDAPAKKPKANFRYRQRNPLSYAAQAGSSEILQLLLDHGAKVKPIKGENPLTEAILSCDGKPHFRVIETLVSAGLKPTHESGPKGSSYPGLAVRRDPQFYSRGVVETLVRCGADPNVVCKRHKSLPLHAAISAGNDKGVKELLDAGADPSIAAPKSKNNDWSGLTSLEYALKINAKKKIIALLEQAAAPKRSGKKQTSKTTKKSAGKPKRLLTAAKAWDAIESNLAANDKALLKSLVKGATASQARKLVGKTKIRLTSEVKEFFQRHNGQTGGEGLIVEPSSGERFLLLSVDRVIKEWEVWQDLDQSGDFEAAEASPGQHVRDCWWHPRWLPFAGNTAGDFLCFDNSPARGGKIGQITTLWHEQPNREVAFASIREMLNEVADFYAE